MIAAVLSGLMATTALAPYAAAQAQPPAAPAAQEDAAKTETRDKARAHFEAGKTKATANDYAGALAEYQAAYALIPTAQAMYQIARCYDGMGDVPNTLKSYDQFISMSQGNQVLAADHDAAKARVAALRAEPVNVAFSSEPAAAQIEIDGQVQEGATPATLTLVPGKHTIKLTLAGYDPFEQEITVEPAKADQALSFTLAPEGTAAAAAAAEAEAARKAAQGEEQGTPNRLPAYITLGVAGAGLITGAVFGVLALTSKSSYNDEPSGDKADKTDRNALICDVALGIGIVAGITGVVLLLDKGPATEQAATKATTPRTMFAPTQLTPYAGPSGAGAAATWRF